MMIFATHPPTHYLVYICKLVNIDNFDRPLSAITRCSLFMRLGGGQHQAKFSGGVKGDIWLRHKGVGKNDAL